MSALTTTYQFRIKDKHANELSRQARAVNFVWNFCNETQKHALKWDKKWPSAYDLMKLAAGSSKELDLASKTIDGVCSQYEQSRRQHRKASLRWRGKKSLGWVPFGTDTVVFKDGGFVFRGKKIDVWLSRPMAEGTRLRSGRFSQDARGRWYINFAVPVGAADGPGKSAIGIDLGLKALATLSTGETIEAKRFYRDLQPALGIAQRAGKQDRAKAIHAKIVNRRKDHLHKLSSRLVQENAAIFVGNVNPASLAKTSMAKSVLDAGWSMFRTQLAYKAIRHGVLFEKVNEAYSTQTCSCCGVIPGSSPKGRAGLGIRGWTCGSCGAVHDRDVNAARNILARGLASLAAGAAPIGRSSQLTPKEAP